MTARRRPDPSTLAAAVGAAAVATWIAWPLFWFPPGEFYRNAEFHSHVYRIVEFLDLLRAGYLFPQWATHFRGGLGAPYFGYYQPGIFYVTAPLAMLVTPTVALALATTAFLAIGATATFLLVRRAFGVAGGAIAAAALLGSVYVGSEIALRGDFAELAAMMLLPVVLWGLVGWLEAGDVAGWRIAAVAAAWVPVLHGIAGMFVYGVAALALGWYAVAGLPWRRVAWGAGALALGAGLAAFYWVPVALEWDLVANATAFQGPFDYRTHFVPPLALVGPHDGRYIDGGVPYTLGPVVPLLVLVNVVGVLRRRSGADAAARRLLVLLAVTSVGAAWLMTAGSAFVWSALPVLPKVQFPWRLLLVVTPLTAALAGAIGWLPVRVRSVTAAAAVGLLLWLSPTYRVLHGAHPYPPIERAADLADVFFAPDLVNEWLPRGVRVLIGGDDDLGAESAFPASVAAWRVTPREPDCRCEQPLAPDGPSCELQPLETAQGRLRWTVRTRRPCAVVLPQYAFVGWRASLGGRPVALAADDRGLMRVALPIDTDAELAVEFGMTPMRRLGVALSGLTLLGWVGGWLVARRRLSRSRTTSSLRDTAGPRPLPWARPRRSGAGRPA